MIPDISIIVPIYNAERYLEKCIKSILNQTFTNFELILVNDGSKDSSGEICKNFAKIDNRIIYIDKENGGSSSAKNVGLDISHGRYIEFVDSDDTIDKEYVEYLFKGTEDEEVDLCVGNVAFVKKAKTAFERREALVRFGFFTLQEYLKFYPEYMPNAIVGAPWNKLFKRDIIQKNQLRFNENLKNNEDTQFNYLYLEKCRKVYVSDWPYYNYMDWGNDSASKSYIEDVFNIYLSTYRKAIVFLKKVGMYEYNEAFTKRYFIGLVIGSINSIVVKAPYGILKKRKKIQEILNNQEVQDAVDDLKYTDKKKRIAVWLIRSKRVNLLYGMFVLNKIRKSLKQGDVRNGREA